MITSIRLARKNLGADRGRLVASVGGVALAFALVLALNAIFAGVANQLTRYIDEAGADVWVAQEGVRNLHMVSSSMPSSKLGEIAAVRGVAQTTPLLYTTGTVTAHDDDAVAYIIGLPANPPMGGPARMADGSNDMALGQAVIDARAASQLGVGIGDQVVILGHTFEVSGLSADTSNLVNSIAFIRFEDFAAVHQPESVISYVLVRAAHGFQASTVAAAIETQVSGTTALATTAFSSEERRLVMDMSGDVIAIMTVIGFVVGLVVVALTVYLATLSRRREFGILKAVGAAPRVLYGIVVAQAVLSVAIGLLVGLAFTTALAVIVPTTGAALELAIRPDSVLEAAAFATVIALVSALIPVRQVAHLDPLIAFRRGGS